MPVGGITSKLRISDRGPQVMFSLEKHFVKHIFVNMGRTCKTEKISSIFHTLAKTQIHLF